MWVLASNTGMRRSELLGLRWSDIAWGEKPRIEVSRTLTAVGYKLVVGEPKTKRGRRTIPLNAETATVLKAWKAAQAEEWLALGPAYQDQGLVFATPMGEPIHPDRLT